jgi:hypothetical protein
MSASLAGMPAELLLKIIENEPLPFHQKRLFVRLRAPCSEINANIVYFFASRHLKHVTFRLDETDSMLLQAVSESALSVHVQDITIRVTTLFEEDLYEDASDTTDSSQCSWYTKEQLELMDVTKCTCAFSESITNFMVSGSCSQMLIAALPRFLNLKAFRISPPYYAGEMIAKKLQEIENRWLVASQILLSAVIAGNIGFEEFPIEPGYNELQLPLSALDMTSVHWPKSSSSLQKLQLELANDLKEGKSNCPYQNSMFTDLSPEAFLMNSITVSAFFRRLKVLVSLQLTLQKSPPSYFKELAIAMPMLVLQRLKLTHISTRYKYLATFLESCKDTLRSLSLHYIPLNDNTYGKLVSMCVDLFRLREIVLRSLNVGRKALYFHDFSELRPKTLEYGLHSPHIYNGLTLTDFDEVDWVLVYTSGCDMCEVRLCADEGDDIDYWIRKFMERVVVRNRMWTD